MVNPKSAVLWVVIRVVFKRQFWVVISVVKKIQLLVVSIITQGTVLGLLTSVVIKRKFLFDY